ncbi:MAG TPA: hypothetical protein VMM59_11230, partial [Thermohalobaculum sp.]|nr:hypothetical protein [Thermohalobaculum sp.]
MPAAEPEQPGFDLPAPGTIVAGHREDGALETSRVLGSEAYAVTMLRDGERITHVPFCYRCGHPRDERIELERYRALWPLEVGRSVTFQRQRLSDGAVWVHAVTVTGTETVDTDFGPVETFVIEETVTGAGGNRWQAARTQWFSPQLGWSVRSEWQAPEDTGSWKIAAIALP